MQPATVARVPLGKRIRDLRRGLGLSQRQLAACAGCDRATVQRVERAGRTGARPYRPTNATLAALARCLGVEPLDLSPSFRLPPQRPPRGEGEPGAIIRRLREARGLSVPQLAER